MVYIKTYIFIHFYQQYLVLLGMVPPKKPFFRAALRTHCPMASVIIITNHIYIYIIRRQHIDIYLRLGLIGLGSGARFAFDWRGVGTWVRILYICFVLQHYLVDFSACQPFFLSVYIYHVPGIYVGNNFTLTNN